MCNTRAISHTVPRQSHFLLIMTCPTGILDHLERLSDEDAASRGGGDGAAFSTPGEAPRLLEGDGGGSTTGAGPVSPVSPEVADCCRYLIGMCREMGLIRILPTLRGDGSDPSPCGPPEGNDDEVAAVSVPEGGSDPAAAAVTPLRRDGTDGGAEEEAARKKAAARARQVMCTEDGYSLRVLRLSAGICWGNDWVS